ncbi:TlpA family protein disulfide reductase [Shewanella sp. MF05960]|uniref:TlpA family protein disulfide reductase n=1 Tax=Shewanella sp. MF05960 TaxID=3434874 RepID=UPI003D794810
MKVFGSILGMLILLMLPLHVTHAAAQLNESVAANFTLSTADGEHVSLSDYAGKPVVIHFWATWCPYCKKLQPGLEKLRLKYQHTDLQMIGISFNEDADANPAQSLLDRGVGMITLVKGDKVTELYEVKGTPTTVFIDRSGHIVWITHTADPNDVNLDKALQYILQ